jgi:hypothetical protein
MNNNTKSVIKITIILTFFLFFQISVFSQSKVSYLSTSLASSASELCTLGFYPNDYKELGKLREKAEKGKSNPKMNDRKYQTTHTVFYCEYEAGQLDGKAPSSYGFFAYLNINGKDIKFKTSKKIKLENPDTPMLPNDVWLKDKNGNKLHYVSNKNGMTLTLIYNKKTTILNLSEENLGG